MVALSTFVAFLSLASATLATPTPGQFVRSQTSDLDGTLLQARKGKDSGAPDSGVDAIQKDINTVSKNLATANNTVTSFKKGGLGAITGLSKINSVVLDLGDSLTATTKTAQNTPTLNTTASTTIGVQFLNVQPNINILLNNLAAKRPDLDGAAFGLLDVRSLIRDSLSTQQDGAKELGTSLIKALDPSLATIAQPINDQIQGNFTNTVKAFDGRSGVIKIPTALVPTVSELLDSVSKALGIVNKRDGEDTNSTTFKLDIKDGSNYCCGITQKDIDNLGTDQSDFSRVPPEVALVFRNFGLN